MRGTIPLRGNFGANRLVVPAGATFALLDGGSTTTTTVNDRIVNNGTVVKSGPGKTTVNPQLLNSGLSLDRGRESLMAARRASGEGSRLRRDRQARERDLLPELRELSGPREDAPKPADEDQPADGLARQTIRRRSR